VARASLRLTPQFADLGVAQKRKGPLSGPLHCPAIAGTRRTRSNRTLPLPIHPAPAGNDVRQNNRHATRPRSQSPVTPHLRHVNRWPRARATGALPAPTRRAGSKAKMKNTTALASISLQADWSAFGRELLRRLQLGLRGQQQGVSRVSAAALRREAALALSRSRCHCRVGIGEFLHE
jgi:hypothetical protein